MTPGYAGGSFSLMTVIDDASKRDEKRAEDDRLREEIKRVADAIALLVQKESALPEVRCIAPALAYACMCRGYSVEWNAMRSQLANIWRSMGATVTGDVVEVVSPEKFDILTGGGGGKRS